MGTKALIDPTTAAATSTLPVKVNDFSAVPVALRPAVPIFDTLVAPGLQGSEVVDVLLAPGNSTPADMFVEDAQVQLTATKNAITLQSSFTITVRKDATVAAVGVFLESAYSN